MCVSVSECVSEIERIETKTKLSGHSILKGIKSERKKEVKRVCVCLRYRYRGITWFESVKLRQSKKCL